MQRKAAAKKGGGADGTAKDGFTLRERTSLKSVKLTQAGKGLGKAGAKRLGRMLQRAIQHQEEQSGLLDWTCSADTFSFHTNLIDIKLDNVICPRLSWVCAHPNS